MLKLSAIFIAGVLLAGCAGMGGKPSLFMDTASVRPPPLPEAAIKIAPKPKPIVRKQAVPLPLSKPVEVPPPPPPPHHWYDHLKFWQ